MATFGGTSGLLSSTLRDFTPGGNQSFTHGQLRSTQSDRSKSQPPHLVFWIYRYNQNLSSDHLLSGVIAD